MPTIIELEQRAEALIASIKDETSAEDARRIEAEHKAVLQELHEARDLQRREFCRQNNLRYEDYRAMDDSTFRSRALNDMGARSDANPTFPHVDVRAGVNDDRETRIAAMSEALYCRLRPQVKPSEAARQFMGLTLAKLARRSLDFNGERTMAMSPSSLITRALHTTSDFPEILAATTGRTLREAYQTAPQAIKRVARQTTAPDFKDKHAVQLSEGPNLTKVNEAGEFTRGTFAEAKEKYRLATYGKIFGITRQALVNDDLSAFDRVPREFGRMAAALEAQTLVDLLVSNPVMGDGKALFHADHGNLAAAGGTISVTTLSAARLAMRSQVGLAGLLISVTPKFLLVSPAKETEAEQVLADLAAAQVTNVNPFSGKLELLVEPRLSGTAWHLVADPAEIDGLEFAHLEDEPGPVLDSRAGFDVDGVEFKVRLDFGAGFVDYRSWYKNPGA